MASLTKEQADEFWDSICKSKGASDKITIQQLHAGLKARGACVCGEKLADIFADLDKDGDKMLSYDEFADCYKKAREHTMREFFDKADVDESGKLDKGELLTALQQCACFEPSKTDEMVQQADTDDDGKISLDEFLKHVV